MWAVALLLSASTLLVGGKTIDHLTLPNAKNCEISYETFPTQTCTPETERKCRDVTYQSESVEYKKKCMTVTSVHCPTTRPPLRKREAHYAYNPWLSARPLYLYPTYHRPAAAAAPPTKPAAAEAVTAADEGCHEVKSKHCFDHPEVVAKPVTSQKCHDVTVMKCQPYEHKVPKTICKPLDQTMEGSSSQKQRPSTTHLYNPFAYNFGWN